MPLVTPGTFTMAALTTELNNDPLGLGYSTMLDSPDSIAARMNTSPEPIVVANQEQIYRDRIESSELTKGIVLSEFTALTAANREYCMMVFGTQWVRTGDANLRTQLAAIFGAATTSRANLIAAAQKNASRSEALWGDGFTVTAQQVYTALGRS